MPFDDRIGHINHGFRIVSIQDDREFNGRAFRMIHDRTGADLFWLDNQAENMVFSITFRTLPADSTGVFHILEHSVLCGSRKYPVREPFVELLKSSMNTFLNAMTFPDMTMFPVSSRNFRDLMNLTHVYLDSVFHPAVISEQKPFLQEGWHIDRDDHGNPEFRGVVYNEMKGAMSEPEALMDRQIMRQLFPDTCYGQNSGGDPEAITSLTWKRFCSEYKACYHPSNSYIYLDGGIDPDEMLEAINLSFDGFSRLEHRPEFRFQIPVPSEKYIRYEISPEESTANHSHLTLARITGSWQDRVENAARSIICDVLTGNNEAPLKREALEKALCKDLCLTVDDTGLQSWISIHAENITDGKENEILSLIEKTGRHITEFGLDHHAVEASLNRLIFGMREDDEPQGISRCIRVMSTWLYGGDPAEALRTQTLIRELKAMIKSGRLNELAADMLMNRNNTAVLHSLPSLTVGDEKIREENTRLHIVTDAWDETQQNLNRIMCKELETWQNTPDPECALKCLPFLTRLDADVVPKWTDTEEYHLEGVRIMLHRIPCNGVIYLRAYFPLTGFSLEELTKAALFAGMLGRLPTGRHDAFSLQQEIRRQTGSLGFAVMALTGENGICTPYLTAFASALEENTASAISLLAEVLTQTLLDNQGTRIRDIMLQNEFSARQRIVSAGHLIAVKSVLSSYSEEGAVRNALDGEPAVTYLHRFAGNPEDELPGFILTAQRLMKFSIRRRETIISVTGTKDPDLRPLLNVLPDDHTSPSAVRYTSSCPHLLGFRIPSQSSFSARGYRLDRCGVRFSGITWLACNILSLEYLWNRVRVQGGSYGAGFQADRSGHIFSYSFRDPTPLKTLNADRYASAFLNDFAADRNKLDKFIISSLNELNPLMSPREEGALADSRKMSGITREEVECVRQEILNAKGDDLIACADWLNRFAEEGSVCIVGPQKVMKSCSGFEIRDL